MNSTRWFLARPSSVALSATGSWAPLPTARRLNGAIGNLYSVMGDILTAMDYYGKAGEIFDKYGWNESNSVLYYNIGETWVDEKDYAQALPAYEKSLDYARTAGDSLLVANALKGLGGLYMDTDRERQVLALIAEGKTNPQIAEALFLSPETIKWNRKKLLAKFDVPTSAALVSKAKDHGLV